MFPRINGKALEECTYDDFISILNDPDFRENENLDYKGEFTVLKFSKEQIADRREALDEFRSDVCSFANAEGGYLVYGIKEKNGIPTELNGIVAREGNYDKLEMDIRNWLQPIKPKPPTIGISFVECNDERRIMIIYVKRDMFAPYGLVINNNDYRFLRRTGNKKNSLSYVELRNMFIESLRIDKEIKNFRKERIDYYREAGWSDSDNGRFILIHLIPETFLDSSYNHNLFVLYKSNNVKFDRIANAFVSSDAFFPMVEGIRFQDYKKDGTECRIYNCGIVEYFVPAENYVSRKGSATNLHWIELLNKFASAIRLYLDGFKNLFSTGHLFVAVSILGCKDAITDPVEIDLLSPGKVDRDSLLMEPMSIEQGATQEKQEEEIKRAQLEFMLSLGIKNHSRCKDLMVELYGN